MFGIRTLRILRRKRIIKKEQAQIQKELEKADKENKKKAYFEDLERLEKKAPEYILTISAIYDTREGTLERMARKGEKIGAEIILDARRSDDADYDYLIGTALIPKNKE